MVNYDDGKISYGCIAYLRKRIQQNCNPKKAEINIILATLFKFYTQHIVMLEEDRIIFNKNNILKKVELEENEKLIYKLLKSVSQDEELIIDDFINPSKQTYLEYRDKFVELNENIEYDLKYNDYYDKKILNFGKKKISKRVLEYMESFDKYLALTKNIIDEKNYNVKFEDIKVCAKISVITDLSQKFLETTKKINFEHKEEFIKYMKNYLKIFQLKESMDENEKKIQSELRSRHISSTEAEKGFSKF